MHPALANYGPWLLLADALTTARLTRLLTRDDLPPLEDLRDRLLARWGSRWGRVWVCPWCMAPWIALAVIGGHTAFAWAGGPTGALLWFALTLPLAIAHLVGLASQLEDR